MTDEVPRAEAFGVPVNYNGRLVGEMNITNRGGINMKIKDPMIAEFLFESIRMGFATSFDCPLPNFVPAVPAEAQTPKENVT